MSVIPPTGEFARVRGALSAAIKLCAEGWEAIPASEFFRASEFCFAPQLPDPVNAISRHHNFDEVDPLNNAYIFLIVSNELVIYFGQTQHQTAATPATLPPADLLFGLLHGY